MWRWIIRAYVSLVLFLFFLFGSGVVLVRVAHALAEIGWPYPLQEIHSHLLVAMFLLGLASGQVILGSNFTGKGWFRSRDGRTYEGFRLEELKPWTWLFGSFIFALGVVVWSMEQIEISAHWKPSLASFYHDFFMPDCSNARFADYKNSITVTCTMHLLFVGILVASVGYSLAPFVRRQAASLLHRTHSERNAVVQAESGAGSSTKDRADS